MTAATTTDLKTTRKLRDLPGPSQAWIFGNALQLDVPNLNSQLEKWALEHGRVFQLRLMRRPCIVIADPALNEVVLRERPEGYRRISHLQPIFEEIGVNGVFSAEGAEWRSQRRLAMEALATRHLRGFYPKLTRILERLVLRWEKAADEERVLDLATEMKLFTVDVTTLLVFGHDIDTLSKEDGDDEVIQKHLAEFFPAFMRRLNGIVPYWRFVRLPQDYRLERAIEGIRQWIEKRVAAARARLASDPANAENPENFIESMLVARDASGQPYTDKVIHANALTMLLAGEDTTAHSIAWAMHHLCDEPAVRGKLREELTRLLGDAIVPATLEEASKLAYTAGVANEAMRLRSVAPFHFNEPLEDVVIGDIEVPKGAFIMLLTRLATLDDGNFANAKAFEPERWIAQERTGAHELSTFVPFGSGPRICPGRALALLEMKMALSTIYQRFDIERVGEASAVREVTAFTLMVEGLRVRVRRRSATPTA